MSWSYHFIDLTDAQKEERRELLDKYASLAQASVFIPLLAIQIVYISSWIRQRRRQDGISSGSPHRKEELLGHQRGIAKLNLIWRKFSWWCGEPLEIGSFYLGRGGEVLLAVAWLAWLLVMCFPETGEDYLHLTKRFGIVAASQLPVHYLLAMKSPYSPLQILTRRSHETLNAFHQLLGRVILTLLYLHAAFYLNFYVQKELLSSKIQEAYIICGILAILSLTAIGTTALAPVRQWSYRVFYIIHITLAATILPILFFHVTHIRMYLYEAAAIYGVNVLLRNLHTRQVSGTIRLLPNTNLIEINIPLSSSPEERHLSRWQAGQHAYISLPGHAFSQTIRSNPFSIASVPSTDGQIRLLARVLDGNTSRLAQEAKATNSMRALTLEGPYGVSNHSENLLRYDRILFVAGGVGGTFIVPLFRQLLADLSPSKGSYRRQKVTFVWIARAISNVYWALPENEAEREGFVDRMKVFVTRSDAEHSITSNGRVTASIQDRTYAESEDEIELEVRKNLLSEGSDGATEKDGYGLSISAGRPNLRRIVGDTLSHGASERVAVFVCGPRSISRSLRRELQAWASRGRDIWYWEEEFSL